MNSDIGECFLNIILLNAMNNIESFNIAVAEVFGQCYQSFPIRINISVIEIGSTIQEAIDGEQEQDIDMRSPEYTIARESINWLIQAGYLWSGQATNMSFNNVTLSPKGLEVLNATPKELSPNTTLGEQLGKGVKVLGKETALGIVKTGLNYGAKIVLGV